MRSIGQIMRAQEARRANSASVEPAGSDKRFAPRRKGMTPALIYFDGTTVSVPCLIKDMSATGAKLELRNGWDNPFRSSASDMDRIRLVVRMDRVMYDCKIIRRGDTELGVKFASPAKPIAKAVR